MRFIINLPLEELAEAERTCFQIEEAQWFYEDFIRPLDPDNLPALNLRNFYMLICQYCPILCDYPAEQHAEAFERFLKYKTRVPVRGAIMLNEAMDAVVLVKGWKKNANWSFPRGKINKEEPDLACAVREVYEETGYDIEAAGLVADGENNKSIEVTMREQSLKLFVFRGVPMDTNFEPRTRKEISKIQWYKLSELPTLKKNKQHQEEKAEPLASNANKFYMVAPFLGHLKKWIGQQRKLDKTNPKHRTTAHQTNEVSATTDVEDQHAEEAGGGTGAIDTLLDAHRQRKQVVQQPVPSDLPEVSQAASPVRRAQPPAHIDTVHNIDTLNKVDLLAILKGGSKPSQEAPPQTPATQIMEEPVMPHSPPHHHLSRMPTLPMAPTLASMQSQAHEPETILPNIPPVRALPPPAQPGKLVPQGRHPNNASIMVTKKEQPQVPALYKQAGDPNFPTSSSQASNQGPSIPPASNLPKPILSQQKASLLDLFKKSKVVEQPVETMANPSTRAEVKDINPKPSTMFVPPQVLSRSSTEKVSPTQPVTNQKANLLAMFKTPSTPKSSHIEDKQSSPQRLSAPVELSAFTSPGHSRESSKADPLSISPGANGHVSVQKRPSPVVADGSQDRSVERSAPGQSHTKRNDIPRVGATINGPLNIPQFDMIAKHHREGQVAVHRNSTKPEKPPAITILPRPENAHEIAPSVLPKANIPPPPEPPRTKQKHGPPKHLRTPMKPVQPPTPNLEAQSTPTKAFHPQILKRPTNFSNNLGEMSPIQPLPSPKQSLPDHKPFHQRVLPSTKADHKKSLLSLFNGPSPLASPSPTTAGMEDNSLASLVSPLSDHRGPQPGLQSQEGSWKEKENNKTIAPTAGPALESPGPRNQIPPNGGIIDDDEPAVEPNNTTTVKSTAMGNNNDDKESPSEHRPSAKETPNELKNLLLGRLANIKI